MSRIIHPIPPIYNENSKMLILGSFPSVKSREECFFYGHPQNRFWKTVSAVLDCDIPQNIAEKKELLLSNGIALWDVIAECEIIGSADSKITKDIPNDLTPILNTADIKAIFTNGKKAYELYMKNQYPITGIQAICLPSTSPANAAWSLKRLIEEWAAIKNIRDSNQNPIK